MPTSTSNPTMRAPTASSSLNKSTPEKEGESRGLLVNCTANGGTARRCTPRGAVCNVFELSSDGSCSRSAELCGYLPSRSSLQPACRRYRSPSHEASLRPTNDALRLLFIRAKRRKCQLPPGPLLSAYHPESRCIMLAFDVVVGRRQNLY